MESILTSIKKMLGIPVEEQAFDTTIIININSALLEINLIGAGPEDPVQIDGSETDWSLFEPSARALVQNLVYLHVKLIFDPPPTSFGIAAIKGQIESMSWKLNVVGDKGVSDA